MMTAVRIFFHFLLLTDLCEMNHAGEKSHPVINTILVEVDLGREVLLLYVRK